MPAASPRPPRSDVQTILLSNAFGVPTLEHLRGAFARVRFELLPADGKVPQHARNATALLRKTMSHEALHQALDDAPGIEWIHTASAGFNWVLTPRVAASDIVLTRTAHVLDKPIAEFVVALSLALLKRLPMFIDNQRGRTWTRPASLGTLQARTAGILGAGAIGRETAKRLRALGMTVLGIKRQRETLPEFDEVYGVERLETVLRQADVLIIACPLTPETRHMIGLQQFEMMKREAILINIARGAIVIEDDLITALTSDLIAGAGLDVFDIEPLPASNPLWTLPNVIVTPHVSYLANENEDDILDEFKQNLQRFLEGEPLQNTIKSRELGY